MTKIGKDNTVFIVDDELGARDSIVSMVRIMGFPVKAFDSGEDFLSGNHHQQVGCVVSDLRMRGMSGITMLATMRQQGSCMPLILVTAYADVTLAVEALERGAMTILEKPYRAQALWDCIVRALQRDQEQRAIASQRANLLNRIRSLNEEESRILEMIVRDVPNKVIAARLQISMRTINHRRSEILTKLQTENLTSLIWHLGEIGWSTVSTMVDSVELAPNSTCSHSDLKYRNSK